MKIVEEDFETLHLGTTIAPGVLRHNAYTVGWEHGAADHRASESFWDKIDELALTVPYSRGLSDGRLARERAWLRAARFKESE